MQTMKLMNRTIVVIQFETMTFWAVGCVSCTELCELGDRHFHLHNYCWNPKWLLTLWRWAEWKSKQWVRMGSSAWWQTELLWKLNQKCCDLKYEIEENSRQAWGKPSPHCRQATHRLLDQRSPGFPIKIIIKVSCTFSYLCFFDANNSPIERGHRWSHVSRPLRQDSQQTPQL